MHMNIKHRHPITLAVVLGVYFLATAAPSAFAQGATRDLSGYTNPGVTFTISIALNPPGEALAIGIEDSPPPGWTDITNITNGGSYDSQTHKVKWGPFFSPFPTEVSYDLLPPANVSGTDCFVGIVSFNGLDEPIVGDQCFPGPIPAVSQWGLVALALLTLSAGTIAVMRRG